MTTRSARFPTLLVCLVAAFAVSLGALVAPAEAVGHYTPPPGVRTNNPLGDRTARRAIISHVIRTIDSTPRKSHIRIASWNIRSDAIVDALIRAHERHVSVRVVMDRGNANPDNPNPGVERLQRALTHHGNSTRKPSMRSHLERCVSSCRGRSGIAHSKFFLFDHAGHAHDVVMNGSFNATDLAAYGQWNDIFTVVGRPGVFQEFRTIFTQMQRDKPVAQGYRSHRFGPTLTTMAFPYTGKHTVTDPVMRELDRVKCGGATNTGDGHTRVRIAQTSWYGDRGKKIAWRVRNMQNNGCRVHIVYAVMGNEVLRILRHEGPQPVPMRQIVQDYDADGVYDKYLHMKVMTIQGHYRQATDATVTINGSANWSPAVLASDEAVLRLGRASVMKRYNGWISYLFHHPPKKYPNGKGGTSSPSVVGRAGTPGALSHLDRYALVEAD
ncbi:MAG: phospholipase D-like domain-containing protein [Nocardioides sp.]